MAQNFIIKHFAPRFTRRFLKQSHLKFLNFELEMLSCTNNFFRALKEHSPPSQHTTTEHTTNISILATKVQQVKETNLFEVKGVTHHQNIEIQKYPYR